MTHLEKNHYNDSIKNGGYTLRYAANPTVLNSQL